MNSLSRTLILGALAGGAVLADVLCFSWCYKEGVGAAKKPPAVQTLVGMAGESGKISLEASPERPQKMDAQLMYLVKLSRGEIVIAGVSQLKPSLRLGQDRVEVNIDATISKDLLDWIAQSGGEVASQVPAQNILRARLPAGSLELLAARSDVRFVASVAEATTDAGIKSESPSTTPRSQN